MRSKYRFSLPFLVAAVAALLSLNAFAADVEQRARIVTTARAIEWHPAAIDPAATFLSVQRPDGEVITETFAAGLKPMLRLDGLADGVYSYELRGAQTGVQSGSFTVANGAVISPDTPERPVPARALRPVAEVYFADDVSARDGASSSKTPRRPASRAATGN